MQRSFAETAQLLAELGRSFYARGWVLGTSGNFSAVTSWNPLRLAVTATGLDKGSLVPAQIVEVDAGGTVVAGQGEPSAEVRLHLMVARTRKAGAVLHTHSTWSTILSDRYGDQGSLAITGYEMLKGLKGVGSHEHQAVLPILENSQDVEALARAAERALERQPDCHGFLLRRHGLYTWGQDIAEAKRHVEILEFLLEVVGQPATAPPGLGTPEGRR